MKNVQGLQIFKTGNNFFDIQSFCSNSVNLRDFDVLNIEWKNFGANLYDYYLINKPFVLMGFSRPNFLERSRRKTQIEVLRIDISTRLRMYLIHQNY